MVLANINEQYPETEACLGYRFRCPYSFTSSAFSYRKVLENAIFILHTSLCLPYYCVAITSTALLLCNHIIGCLSVDEAIHSYAWSLACQLACNTVFLVSRYRKELGERRIFLLLSEIGQTEASSPVVLGVETVPHSI
jgi:hypothetical protein